jgi:uncharacterized cupin superfamily protein
MVLVERGALTKMTETRNQTKNQEHCCILVGVVSFIHLNGTTVQFSQQTRNGGSGKG